MVTHPGAGTTTDTLVHALLAHCQGSLSGIGGVERPGIVHRLDRETSGAIVVAKSDRVHQRLTRAFQDRAVEKIYGALVSGSPNTDSGAWDSPIARHPTQRHRMAVAKSGGRSALTEWSTYERFGEAFTWLSCVLKTGRTHQIRVHCQHARLPILGDKTYGWKGDADLLTPPQRVMLHAWRLAFRHPITRARISCEAPWPIDFLHQVDQLRSLTRPTASARRRHP
jgi:23S rRNA pseudouridine1911/1915/1917 synthase